jgi:hypothetical protein
MGSVRPDVAHGGGATARGGGTVILGFVVFGLLAAGMLAIMLYGVFTEGRRR